MAAQEIEFGDASIDKKEFYSSKHTLSLKDVQLGKIVTSNKWEINETTCKYYAGYCKDSLIRPLCVIMPQMNGYIATVDVDSVLKVDKKVYPQAYLEQCKYKLNKRKPVDFIDIDIIDDSESDDE